MNRKLLRIFYCSNQCCSDWAAKLDSIADSPEKLCTRTDPLPAFISKSNSDPPQPVNISSTTRPVIKHTQTTQSLTLKCFNLGVKGCVVGFHNKTNPGADLDVNIIFISDFSRKQTNFFFSPAAQPFFYLWIYLKIFFTRYTSFLRVIQQVPNPVQDSAL